MNITGLDGDLSALSIDQSEIVSATLLWAGLGAVLLLGMTFYMGTNAAGQVAKMAFSKLPIWTTRLSVMSTPGSNNRFASGLSLSLFRLPVRITVQPSIQYSHQVEVTGSVEDGSLQVSTTMTARNAQGEAMPMHYETNF